MTKAADELHVSSGAIGHQIRALEQELGFRLFDRSSGELAPSAAALDLAAEISGGLDRIFDAVRRLRLAGDDPSFLTIGCDVSFGLLWLGPRIARFHERHPGIEVRVDLTDGNPGTLRPSADLMIRFGDGRFADQEAIRLTSESLSPVCAPSRLRGTAPLGSPSDVLFHPLLHVAWFEPDLVFSTLAWEKWLAQAGVGTRRVPGMHLSHTASALQLAIGGHGIALASDSLASDAIASGLLVRPFDITLKVPRDFYLVFERTDAEHAKIAAFRDWLLSETAPLRSI